MPRDLNTEDGPIQIKASILQSCREKLKEIRGNRFRPTELYLALATLGFGGLLGGWTSGIATTSEYAIPFFAFLSAIAAAGLVAYLAVGHYRIALPEQKAEEILKALPNPHKNDSVSPELRSLEGHWQILSETHPSKKTSEGELDFRIRFGQIAVSGVLRGEKNEIFGQVTTIYCHFDEDQRQLLFMYRLSSFTDNKILDVNECIFTGILFDEPKKKTFQGHWFHLSGPRISGQATLCKDS